MYYLWEGKKSMKIYCAGPWTSKPALKIVANLLRNEGFEVVSRWHDTTHNSNIYEAPEPVMVAEALKDMEDIMSADTLVYMNLSKSEGKATELGISLNRGIPIYVVGGKQNNVFLHLPQITHMSDLFEVIKALHETGSI